MEFASTQHSAEQLGRVVVQVQLVKVLLYYSGRIDVVMSLL